MTARSAQLSPVLGLLPEQFADPAAAAAALDAVSQALLLGAPTGITVDAPIVVPASSPFLPLLGAWRRSFVEDRVVPFHRCAVLVALHEDTGSVRVASAFDYKDPGAPDLPPDEPAPEGAMVDPFTLDAVERLGPLEPGTWSLCVVVLGYASNVARVLVEPGASGLAPPRSAVWPVPGAARFPSYRPSGASPAVPSGLGLNLDVGRVVLSLPGTVGVLHASGRVASAWVCPLVAPPDAQGDDWPRGALPITLVLSAASLPEPWTSTVVAAVYEPVDGAEVPVFLALDLFALPGFPRGARTLYLWAFTAGLRAGPAVMALITQEMLAPG